MIEVEAKAAITNPHATRVCAACLGTYVGSERKIDDYYALKHHTGYPHKSLRVRKRRRFYEINFKHLLSYAHGVYAKKETEFKISNVHDFVTLIEDFGYRRWMRKIKQSYIYQVHPHFHIEINHVTGLGWFVEVEYLCKTPSQIPQARIAVLRTLHALGIEQKKLVKKGYTKLIWDKNEARKK